MLLIVSITSMCNVSAYATIHFDDFRVIDGIFRTFNPIPLVGTYLKPASYFSLYLLHGFALNQGNPRGIGLRTGRLNESHTWLVTSIKHQQQTRTGSNVETSTKN